MAISFYSFRILKRKQEGRFNKTAGEKNKRKNNSFIHAWPPLFFPYGLQVEWETVDVLAKAKTFDLFVNFPLGAVTRLLKRDQPPKGKTRALLNKVIGSTDWIQALYRPSPQLSLFGEEDIERDVIRAEWLASLYSDRISKLFDYVSRPVIMRNSKNAPLYALFLASNNDTPISIVNDVFRNFGRVRELR